MRKPLLALLLTSTMLAGCNFAPAWRQPVASVSTSFHDAAPIGGETARGTESRLATDLGWRDYFGDERLQTLIGLALANNRDLAQSLARVAQARAQYRIQASQRLPAIDASAGYTKTRQPLGATGFDDLGGGGIALPEAFIIENYTANVATSSFELDLWGRVRNLSDQARAQYLASVQGARAFRLSLVSQVAAAYYAIRSGEERIALAQDVLKGRLEGQRIARKRLDAGVTSTVDYDQTVLLVTQARTELAELQRTTDQSRNLLAVLVGGPVAGDLPAGRPLDVSGQFDAIDAGLPSALLANRPDILQAEFALRAANANIGGAGGVLPDHLADRPVRLSGDRARRSVPGQYPRLVLWRCRYPADLRLGPPQGAAAPEPRAGRRTDRRLSARRPDRFPRGRRRTCRSPPLCRADRGAGRYGGDAAASRPHRPPPLRSGTVDLSRGAHAERNLFAAQQQLIDLRSIALQNGVSLGGGLRERWNQPPQPVEVP